MNRLKDATIAIVNKVPIRRPALERLPALRLIAVAATGTDNIDVAAARERGVVVSNIRDYAIHTVPEHTFALILALRRSIAAFREDVRAGEWQRSGQFCFFNHPINDLHGATLGIVGEGAIGQAVATLGRAFGMRVFFAAHKGSTGMGPLYTPFDEVLAASDVGFVVSFQEAGSYAACESLAMGLPTLVSDAGGLPELVRHGIDGWILPAGNVDAAESWLRDRLMNPLPADMPAAARARALDCFSMPVFAEKTLAFYRRVCARGQPI